MSAPIKNVLIAGASGSVGAPILKALLEEPSFNITILSRGTSAAKFPNGVPVKRVSDDFTTSELTEVFKGQDAVVVAITTTAVVEDVDGSKGGLAFRLIDAAVAAGVHRFIPSEYGTNNLDPRPRKLVPVYDRKGEVLEYLMQKANDSHGKLTWTSISCGTWLDWGLDPARSGNFLGIDVKARKATIWDSGNSRTAVTTSANTGLAVARALTHADLTENKQVFLADFTTTPNAIVHALETQTASEFSIQRKDSVPELKSLREKFDSGEFAATFSLLAITAVADVDVAYDLEKEQEIWNEKLGLPKITLEDVIGDAVKLAKGS
ncbi:NAD(P)-binding protein [Ophiobolus disseminans]|uniref:NAD(P)-binding protein n=1 Tax=Ophiobolus disseminans TaxID=1469910 RepID=A0A6A7AHD2_9PLEO|nr:NAD(P)-binding protein [Ophiobolus disseminans]